MGVLSSLLGIFGFGIGFPFGLLLGFFIFIYSKPTTQMQELEEEPIVRPLYELDTEAIYDLLAEIPLWVKRPDYERVDWLNIFISDMWPYLDKAICSIIRNTAQPIFAEYIGKYWIKRIEFETLTLGTIPPKIHGIKVYETNEKELVMEPAFRWAGNPNITLMLKLFSLRLTIQLVDLQVFAAPRIALKPLVPSFPCFANAVISLMEKPYVDAGLKILGGDIMSIPGLYRFIQESIIRQVASLYLWPRSLEIPILDASTLAIKRPVGILHVNVKQALKLLKMDFLGASDPYVKLSLSGENLPSKKTTVKRKTLNPEWNENFKLTVKDPQSQTLQLNVFDWDKVGSHDKLGSQIIPLKHLTANKSKEFTLELLKNTNISDPHKNKRRGQLIVELMYSPFKEDDMFTRSITDSYERKESESCSNAFSENGGGGSGLLMVVVQGAENVEGKSHNNPYVLVIFRGEKKTSKTVKKTRDPVWNEEFQFVLEEAPIGEKIHIQVMSKRTRFAFQSKESLGHVDINLTDVVHNGRINEKYHLINSKNGMIHVEVRWKTI